MTSYVWLFMTSNCIMVGLLTVFETAIWILNFVTPTKYHNEPIRCSQLYHQWFWRWLLIWKGWIKLVNEAKLKFLTCELIRSNYFSAEFYFAQLNLQPSFWQINARNFLNIFMITSKENQEKTTRTLERGELKNGVYYVD